MAHIAQSKLCFQVSAHQPFLFVSFSLGCGLRLTVHGFGMRVDGLGMQVQGSGIDETPRHRRAPPNCTQKKISELITTGPNPFYH